MNEIFYTITSKSLFTVHVFVFVYFLMSTKRQFSSQAHHRNKSIVYELINIHKCSFPLGLNQFYEFSCCFVVSELVKWFHKPKREADNLIDFDIEYGMRRLRETKKTTEFWYWISRFWCFFVRKSSVEIFRKWYHWPKFCICYFTSRLFLCDLHNIELIYIRRHYCFDHSLKIHWKANDKKDLRKQRLCEIRF